VKTLKLNKQICFLIYSVFNKFNFLFRLQSLDRTIVGTESISGMTLIGD